MENSRIRFYEEKTSFWPQAAVVMLVLASVCQFVGNWGAWTDRSQFLMEVALPLVSFLCFALFLMLFGKYALWLTFVPFLAGLLYYAYGVWYHDDRVVMIIGLAFCVVSAVLYLGTVFTVIRTKWLLALLFVCAFLYRAFYRDVMILQKLGAGVSFTDGMREMSLLSVLLAMSFVSLGMRRQIREKRPKATEQAYELSGKEPYQSSQTTGPVTEPEPVTDREPVPAQQTPEMQSTYEQSSGPEQQTETESEHGPLEL